jgi:hypothetical protein
MDHRAIIGIVTRAWAGISGAAQAESKAFFSEEKKQKTFGCLAFVGCRRAP